MSYQVLARKWRPQNFKQMVGQEHVLKALIHALESQRLHHAYLFTGTRGVGKTTIGRILAKCLSCDTGITSEPCGSCGACTSISEGRYVDLIEIDAASRTKVEDMRELLDNVQYAPTEGRFKIYLIDEVHMLSQSSFNALLKTLEEPPEHVKFLFATTDPQKLPVTILSRCLQFNLKNMSPERIVGHLQHILREEEVGYEDPALWALARAADGSMRDALSLTDQAIAYGNHQLGEESVSAMLGTVDQKRVYRILNATVANDAKVMLEEVKDLSEYSPDYSSVLANLISILHRVAVEQAVPGATDNAMGDKEEVQSLARRLCAENLQLYYQIALACRNDMDSHPDPRSGLEMALLRMMAFQLEKPATSEEPMPVLNAGEVASGHLSSDGSGHPGIQHGAESAERQASVEAAHVTTAVESTIPVSDTVESVAPSPMQEVLPPELPEPPIEAYSEPEVEMAAVEITEPVASAGMAAVVDEEIKKKTELKASSDSMVEPTGNQVSEPIASVVEAGAGEGPLAEPDNGADLPWPKQVLKIAVTGMTQNLLFNMAMQKQDDQITLNVETGHFRLLNDGHRQRIENAIRDYFGDSVQIAFIEGLDAGQETPMMWRERRAAELLAQAKEAVQQDPNVQELIREFDAILVDESIKALETP